MLIGGLMSRQGDSIEEKVKTIVDCPKGVSVLRIMFSALRELFLEFIFLDSLSIRYFIHCLFSFDIVFSLVPIETEINIFSASSFLKKEEKSRLRKQVMMEMYGQLPSELDMDTLISIIKNEATIHDEERLREDLYRYIRRDDASAIKNKEAGSLALSLKNLITPETIRLEKGAASWEEAIRIASEPLIAKGYIKPAYVEAMVNRYDKDPYIIIGPNLAIPHAAPDEGVNQVSMSLLRLEEGVAFTEEYRINIIVVIAAEDKQKHLKALM